MNQYRDFERGKFQTEYAKQLVSFDGMLFKGRNGISNVSPTDVDGVVQLDNENCVIFFELKHSGDVPDGQKKALKYVADAIIAGGRNCIVIVGIHNTKYPEPIIAKDAQVSEIYFKGEWREITNGRKLYEVARNYVNWIKDEQEKERKACC